MSDNTKIEWSDATWNPVLGCSKVSEGCRLCYAIRSAWVKQHNPNPKVREAYAGLVEQRPDGSLNWTGRVNAIPERLEIPLHWKMPKRIFVNSLSDLFHPNVSDDFIDKVFGVMALARHHTFQVLTKRPERMAAWFSERFQHRTMDGGVSWGDRSDRVFEAMQDFTDPSNDTHFDADGNFVWPGWPLPNVWLGTSTEDQRTADERIPHLLATPAAVRFLSCEPLLGPVDLSRWIEPTLVCKSCDAQYGLDQMVPDTAGDPPHIHGADQCAFCDATGSMISVWGDQGIQEEDDGSYLDNPDLRDYGYRIHWVIAGSESGPGARPCDLDWVRGLRDQCVAAAVSFFWKQHVVNGRKIGLPTLDGQVWAEFPSSRVPASV